MRTAFDFTPYRRSTIGFDRLFDALEASARAEASENYPVFDVERRGDDQYRITLAVAGFNQNELTITAHQNVLTVAGRKADESTAAGQYLHRGIAMRAFERRFQLADFVQVRTADLKDGLLHIDLVREVPETMKPRTVAIGNTVAPTIEATANQPAAATQPVTVQPAINGGEARQAA